MINKKIKIAIIGLGYVGLPVAVSFSKKFTVIGFDTNKKRVIELKDCFDKNKEFSKLYLKKANKLLTYTSYVKNLSQCNVYIVAVPTPINKKKEPDLSYINKANTIISKVLKKNDVVIYESTFYPGCTEEYCALSLQNLTNLKFNKDFFCGYSPERINPGMSKYKIDNIIKLTSGSTPKISKFVNNLYKKIIKAGTYNTSSIKIAESAKIIENAQRDINIAFMNELSIFFDKLNIDTNEVINAAKTKWNFIDFKPGLVGGHCIGVDPYYLSYKADNLGYKTQIILSGRKINDNVVKFIIKKLIIKIIEKKIKVRPIKILNLGLSFKENCTDLRNSMSLKLVKKLSNKNCMIYNYDPIVYVNDSMKKKLNLISKPQKKFYDVIILSVSHNYFKKLGIKKILSFSKNKYLFFDLKSLFPKKYSDFRL